MSKYRADDPTVAPSTTPDVGPGRESGRQLLDQDDPRHLTQTDLARRWRKSERTLESWRWKKTGPPYLKIGGRVIYRLEDIEAFELAAMSEPKG